MNPLPIFVILLLFVTVLAAAALFCYTRQRRPALDAPTRLQSPDTAPRTHHAVDVDKPLEESPGIQEHASPLADIQQQLKNLTALQNASAIILSTLDLNEVLSTLAEQLGQAADVASVYIYSFNPQTMTASVIAEYFSPNVEAATQTSLLNTTYDVNKDFPELIAPLHADKAIVRYVDAPDLSNSQRLRMQQAGAQTSLIIPLQYREVAIGMAELHDNHRREFSAAQIALCQEIAQQGAIAIHHARRYNDMEQQATGLNTLYTISRMVGQSLVLDEVLSQALSSLLILLEFETGAVSLVNPHTGHLEIVAQRGVTRPLSKYLDDSHPDTLHQYVHSRQEVLILFDISGDIPIRGEDLLAANIKGCVGIPLLHGRRSLGVISLFTYRSHTTPPISSAILTAIGQQIAIAVTNARLFQTVKDERGRLKALIDASRDGVIMIGVNQRVLVINTPALEYLQLPGTPDNWADRPLTNALSILRRNAPDATRATLTELQRIRRGDEPPGEGEYQVAGRTLYWLNLPVLAEDTPLGRLIVLRDVTRERQLEKLRDDLTHTMVHDLRNPLTAIAGALQMLEMIDPTPSDEQKRLIEMAIRNSQKLLDLISGILDVNRLESGRLTLELRRVNLSKFVHDVLQIQQPLADQKAIRLETRLPPELPPVWADIRLLERIFQNLVGNALKFTPFQGVVTITATAEPATQPPSSSGTPTEYLTISIADTGPGIPPDIQPRLFQKFTTGNQVGSGSGLGLVFCKLAVEAHGGHIWVESTPGQGATFHFTLPIAVGASPIQTRAIQAT